MDTETADVCVVGAGPAGLTLALLLLRSGASVTMVERTKSFDREYRGEILQPGAMRLLDELQVLAGARERGGYELSRFQLVEHGKVAMNIDYRALPQPHNFLLSIPQRHVLEELHAACARHDGFTYLPGCSVKTLLRDGSRVTGITCAGGENAYTVRSRVVVAADGRYSKTRRLAGIEYTRLDMFDHDVLWFRVPAYGRDTHEVSVYRAGGNPVLIYDSYPNSVQIGWTLPHNGYRTAAGRGVEYVRGEITRAAPPYADEIAAAVRSLSDLTLLDVFSGYADDWAIDGLVLAGDSAHTHSPIGAQGINLAVQDAVLLHPVLMTALHTGNVDRAALSSWVPDRRADIDKVIALQQRQSKAMLGGSANGRVSKVIRPAVAKLLAYTPIYKKILNQIAFGSRPISIQSSLFLPERGEVRQ
jgi:6-methylpretetramide 4-monooxygenase